MSKKDKAPKQESAPETLTEKEVSVFEEVSGVVRMRWKNAEQEKRTAGSPINMAGRSYKSEPDGTYRVAIEDVPALEHHGLERVGKI